MDSCDLVGLSKLMRVTSGRSEIAIGLLDGSVAIDHPDLAGENIREIPRSVPGNCSQVNSPACLHGTFIAGILSAKRSSAAPAICPNCTLLVRPIFTEIPSGSEQMPSTTPAELASAIIDS